MAGVVRGIAHVGYTTSDLETAVDFHAHKLGIENKHTQVSDQPYLAGVTGVKDCRLLIGFVTTSGSSLPLEIIEYEYPKGLRAANEFGRAGSSHICWETDDLQAAITRLRTQGICTISEPEVLTSGPWKRSERVFLRSPDGLPIELLASCKSKGNSGRFLRLHHVSFTVSDIENTRCFFRKLLGMDEVAGCRLSGTNAGSDSENIPVNAAYFRCPNTELVIELQECQPRKKKLPRVAVNDTGCVHLCLMVDGIKEAYEILKMEGVEFAGPPTEITHGINKGAFAIYFQGPDGIKFELFQGPPTRVT